MIFASSLSDLALLATPSRCWRDLSRDPRSLGGGGGLLFDRLSKALTQLFLVCEHIMTASQKVTQSVF